MPNSILEFRSAMSAVSLASSNDIISDGNIHRYHVEGDKVGSKNGWYIFHVDGIAAGCFGSWKTGVTHTWCAKNKEAMSGIERNKFQQYLNETKKKRKQEREKIAQEAKARANKIWKESTIANTGAYLIAKGVKSHGLHAQGSNLVVPLRDTRGTLHSLQFILPNGEKRFLTGGKISGHYYSIGKPDKCIYICEGYATGATIHEATEKAVAIAFNASNLKPVAQAISKKLPSIELIIAADNDQWTENNPGVTKAKEAAQAVNAKFIIPLFKDTASKPTDFNDLQQAEGIEEVRNQLNCNAEEMEKSSASIIQELAALPTLEYDQQREKVAEKLCVRKSTLDAEVEKVRKNIETDEEVSIFKDYEPWPHSVDGGALLDDICDLFLKYMVLPDYSKEAIALWVLHTHCHNCARISPLLAPTSPEKRCGKTTLLSLLMKVVKRPLPASNITPAALFRAVEHWQPTLLIDEADTFLRNNDELRGIINSGHTRDTAFVIRTQGDNFEPTRFCTWGPKAIALIGSLPPTLTDRSIIISLRRKKPDESVERLQLDKINADEIIKKCIRWATDHENSLKKADPKTPTELHDRAADNWRPLLSIADAAGGDWPTRARKAAKALTPTETDDDAAGVLLLRDIQTIFEKHNSDKIASAILVDDLIKMEERPWPEWRKGKPITTRQVARLLQPFDIKPKVIRTESGTPRGYLKSDLYDAFSRYLAIPSATTQQSHNHAGSSGILSATQKNNVADKNNRKPAPDIGCCVVADEIPL